MCHGFLLFFKNNFKMVLYVMFVCDNVRMFSVSCFWFVKFLFGGLILDSKVYLSVIQQ